MMNTMTCGKCWGVDVTCFWDIKFLANVSAVLVYFKREVTQKSNKQLLNVCLNLINYWTCAGILLSMFSYRYTQLKNNPKIVFVSLSFSWWLVFASPPISATLNSKPSSGKTFTINSRTNMIPTVLKQGLLIPRSLN